MNAREQKAIDECIGIDHEASQKIRNDSAEANRRGIDLWELEMIRDGKSENEIEARRAEERKKIEDTLEG